jgi:hypothetical protein
MATTDKSKLAARWAPIHYQEVSFDNSKADFIVKIDFGGTWNTTGNWDRLDSVQALTGAVYYSVAETATHWYIIYMFYHPRDWDNIDQHENDIEGLIAIVQKPFTKMMSEQFPYGIYVGMITVAHNNYYSYSNALASNRESIDAEVRFEKGPDRLLHPCSYQEPLGHGCYAYKGRLRPYIRYEPVQPGQALTRPADIVPRERNVTKQASYELIDMMQPGGLWEKRWSGKIGEPFVVSGQLAGTKHGLNAANPPWRWEDLNDGPDLQAGNMAYDPAYLAWQYFSGHCVISVSEFFDYIDMPYVSAPMMMYGQPADGNLLNRYFNSANKYEKLGAASLMVSSGPVNPAVAEWLVTAACDKEICEEACAIIANQLKRNNAFGQMITPAVDRVLSDPTAPNEPERVLPLIKLTAYLKDQSIKHDLVRIYKQTANKFVRAISLNSLRSFAKVDNSDFADMIRKDTVKPAAPIVREAASRLYRSWYLEDDPQYVTKFTSADYSNVRRIAAESAGNLGWGGARPILEKLINDKSWDIRTTAAAALINNFEKKGANIIKANLKDEYNYADSLAKSGGTSWAGDFTDCPKKSKDYGRLYLIAATAEGIKKLK